MNDYYIIYGLTIISLIITSLAQLFVSSSYSKYQKVKNERNITGYEAARNLLDKHDLQDIKVVETSGYLTDHYDPTQKVIRLSSDVFHGNSIAAVAVAAHECGHAIQDKEDYSWYKIRASLVPIVNFVTYAAYIFFAISVILQLADLIGLSIVLVSCSLLFQVVTLPVEFDASKRGLAKLEEYGLIEEDEESGASSVLRAAALTYVASLLSSILNLIRLIMVYDDRRK